MQSMCESAPSTLEMIRPADEDHVTETPDHDITKKSTERYLVAKHRGRPWNA